MMAVAAASSRRTYGTVSGIRPGIGGRRRVQAGRRCRLRARAVPQESGGDGTDGEDCASQDDVAGDRVVEPGLGLVVRHEVAHEGVNVADWRASVA
jgi:hypothetical protein